MPTVDAPTSDAIVVGARCAGAPTAMLLARAGHRVLLVDRATFPSDTLSTHVVHAPGVAALRRWGLLHEVAVTGCPPVHRYAIDFGPFTIAGTPQPADGVSAAYAPRRRLLDRILVDAADAAGAEVREAFTVTDVIVEDGRVVGVRGNGPRGRTVEERGRVVVGADGRGSRVARAVRAEAYREVPVRQWSAFTYFSGLPVDGFEIVIRPHRGWGAIGTNDGLTMVVVGWPVAEAHRYRADVERHFLETLELAPGFAERARAARREERFAGGAVPGWFRKPYGPGWVLVGDAGYNRDPITAQGISDAFADAERWSAALHDALTGARPFEAAAADAHRARDARVGPMYEFTAQLAALEPPPPELQALLAAVAGNPSAMDAFVSVTAGTLSPAAFFDPEQFGSIMASAPAS